MKSTAGHSWWGSLVLFLMLSAPCFGAGTLVQIQANGGLVSTANPLPTSAVGGGGAVTIADGAAVTIGAMANAKSTATDTTPITAMSVWKQISASVQSFVTQLPAALGAGGGLKVDGSGTALPVSGTVAATQSGTWTVQPGNTANTTAWKVDGSAVTQPVSGTITASNTAGNVAEAGTDSGNPVKVGGIYQSTLPTYTDGQRANLHVGTRGGLHVNLYGADQATGIASLADNADAVAASGTASNLREITRNTLFNGSTWDREFTCASSATISVTAANTTQLVALQASQVIRVCSFVLTESLAGTAKFVYGTGSNCGTGTTDLTAAMALGTNSSIEISAPTGGSLIRTASANALCLTAVTGNITGFVSYTQF